MSSKNNNRAKSVLTKMKNFFCICKKSPNTKKHDLTIQSIPIHPIQSSQHETEILHSQNIINPLMLSEHAIVQIVPKNNIPITKIRIKTKHLTNTIEYKDFHPDKDLYSEYKYCCPICFRYFNKILKSTCCQNYCCYYCIKDMNSYLKKQSKSSIICNFCTCNNFIFVDVDQQDPIKKYTDSPFINRIPSKKSSEQKSSSSRIPIPDEKLSKFNELNKKLELDFSKINLNPTKLFKEEKFINELETKVQKSSEDNDEWNSRIHRSPSPLSSSYEKINKLKGIMNNFINNNEIKNKDYKNANKKGDQTLFASRNYLVHGKSFCFQS